VDVLDCQAVVERGDHRAGDLESGQGPLRASEERGPLPIHLDRRITGRERLGDEGGDFLATDGSNAWRTPLERGLFAKRDV
jgi:hypothetical protein